MAARTRRNRNQHPVEAKLDEVSRRLRAALADKGFQVSPAEADFLACAGFAAMVEVSGPQVVGQEKADELAGKFLQAARHCAARAAAGE